MPAPKVSTKPVFQKLGLKPAHRATILSVPPDVKLGKTPAGAKFEKSFRGEFDFVLGFYESQKALEADLAKARKALTPSGMAWVCWRKGGVTELSRETIWAAGEKAGLESVASCAIDDAWSALKLMFPKSQRR
jgi:hypothetical protein